jgi:hypothetical protein
MSTTQNRDRSGRSRRASLATREVVHKGLPGQPADASRCARRQTDEIEEAVAAVELPEIEEVLDGS